MLRGAARVVLAQHSNVSSRLWVEANISRNDPQNRTAQTLLCQYALMMACAMATREPILIPFNTPSGSRRLIRR